MATKKGNNNATKSVTSAAQAATNKLTKQTDDCIGKNCRPIAIN